MEKVAVESPSMLSELDSKLSAEKMNAPKAFISYSHDSHEHKAWVLKLGSDLRSKGVDVVLDQWDLSPGQDVSMFMQAGITDASRVLMICSSPYVQKSEGGLGGVGYKRLIVTAEMLQSIDTKKFVPIVRGSVDAKKVPSFLGPRLYINFESDPEYELKLDELVREIHGFPSVLKPPLGPNPFSGTPISSEAAARADRSAHAIDRLNGDWFSGQQNIAQIGAAKLKLNGQMELRFAIQPALRKSQIELLGAVRESEIRTFGWPIGIMLESRDEYRPRPHGDGIRAEVSIGGGSNERKSYDYWALQAQGDFYLLQSLFEDSRVENAIFFDTRIVRVTESLIFAESLYRKLGAPLSASIAIRVTHRGIRGRKLISASSSRYVVPRHTEEEASTSEIETVLETMKQTRVEDVKRILEPMFMLFDFQQFNDVVYEELVRKFEQGQI
jgi:TIR domain-containing protein